MVKVKDFEDFIKRLIKGADNVNFRDVVKASTEYEILEVDGEYSKIVLQIKKVLNDNIEKISKFVETNYKGRANELGNFLENVLVKYITKINNFKTKRKGGYPDIYLDANGKHTYIECKIFQRKTIASTLRSFYFKVSDKSNIKHSCPHILIGFEVESLGKNNKSPFIVKGFKIVDLYDLKVNLKPEFNANNPMIYQNCKNL